MEVTCPEKFQELLDELGCCSEIEQKQIIEEMNEAIDRMDEKEFESILATELFNKVDKMIKEKNLSMENAILLLKHVGYYKVLLNLWCYEFYDSLLCGRFEKLIIEEEKKNEEKNENLLVDLCECYAVLNGYYISREELFFICVSCLLKVALKKEEDETTQKEVEMALLALTCLREGIEIKKKKNLKKIKGIIKYHQKHHNHTHVAYQSAWNLLIIKNTLDKNYEKLIVNELHFGMEATRELEELVRCVDWKKKEKDSERRMKMIDFAIVDRWLDIIEIFFEYFEINSEEFADLTGCMIRLCRVTRGNRSDVVYRCCSIFVKMIIFQPNLIVFNDLMKSGVFDFILEEVHNQTFNDCMTGEFLIFFLNVSRKLKEKEKDENEEVKRILFDKMEEEGFEDVIASFHEMFNFLSSEYFYGLSLNVSDYYLNA
ncbi:uncharacterized protein MONOS_18593 [Monocercomonoides exilis]|uniref:uncharacterized protein n=1 Tax=Monocercomonoides exilis TaxID=2049356 RepID=UPI00355991F5|nr:hypothetical protein MONOS_18593 [Monocercomonoides exilis]